MREIEFRGIDNVTKNWIYGDLVRLPTEGGSWSVPPSIELKTYIANSNTLVRELVEVDPKTVSQYIGIKDVTNRKVFKGDIAKVKRFIFRDCHRKEVEEIEDYIGEVVWHQFGWHVAEKIEHGIRYHSLWLWNVKDDETDSDTHFMEIVGYRYNNPEMGVII